MIPFQTDIFLPAFYSFYFATCSQHLSMILIISFLIPSYLFAPLIRYI
ncbi:hypothetical protein CLOSCI_02279 [[Clostridium] scindens ATCC 35704]|nr:hypothetical protein CLOSCI_02279 [[Clostridium] scindens ATCC 35704]